MSEHKVKSWKAKVTTNQYRDNYDKIDWSNGKKKTKIK